MVEQSEGKSALGVRGDGREFGAIVGQADLKEALLAIAANDALDGLLIRGEKGTGKSTAVRALADLLPRQVAIEGCPYGCPPGAVEQQCPECRARSDPPTTHRQVPLVTVPLGATRERVLGTLSVADALAGDYEFDSGLLARANRGILYVDEVNLLDDHLVDVLLDAAASGVNRVERDGISLAHPAAFTLVGTMNPEEGDLRPQLRDRFALQTTVTGCADVEQRVAIVERALGIDEGNGKDENDGSDGNRPTDGDGVFDGEGTDADAAADGGDGRGGAREETATGETALDPGTRLRRAHASLDDVILSGDLVARIARLCRDAGVEGHRGDIATARGAKTLAALDGRPTVLDSDVRRAAALALPHRLQSRPFEDAPDPEDVIDEHFDDREAGEDELGDADGEASDGEDGGENEAEGGRNGSEEPSGADDAGREDGPDSPKAPDRSGAGNGGNGAEGDDDPAEGPAPSGDRPRRDGDAEASERADDRREEEQEDGNKGGAANEKDDSTDATPLVPGRSAAAVGEGRAPDLPAFDAAGDPDEGSGGTRSRARPSVTDDGPRIRTERANEADRIDVPATVRAAGSRGASRIETRDLRRSVRRREARGLVLFVVDASASMRPAMRAAKGVVVDLLKDAYQERDEVGFVTFAGDDAEVLLPPTDSVSLAARHLKDLPTGDRTPLPAGLRTASEVIERADPAASVVVVVTDGRANVAAGSPVGETRAAARRLGGVSDHTVVVDAGDEGNRTGLTGVLVEETGGERLALTALSAERIDGTVGAVRES